MQGIKEGSKLPPGMTEDPGKLSKEQLAELGVTRLPASVGEAHDRLNSDTCAHCTGLHCCLRSPLPGPDHLLWPSPPLVQVFLEHSRFSMKAWCFFTEARIFTRLGIG